MKAARVCCKKILKRKLGWLVVSSVRGPVLARELYNYNIALYMVFAELASCVVIVKKKCTDSVISDSYFICLQSLILVNKFIYLFTPFSTFIPT